MTFNGDFFNIYLDVILTGIATGFVSGFMLWAIGFAIYSIIKLFKLA